VKILVTGGSGFIGSHVIDKLILAGHEPRILDLIESPYHNPASVETTIGNLSDRDCVRQALRGCDAIIHLAAASDPKSIVEAPLATDESNTRGTITVLEAARRDEVSRVLFASTIWVYDGVRPSRAPVSEERPLARPAHLYTATKLAGELYCHSYGELYDLGYTIMRFGIAYGPRAPRRTVLAAFVDAAQSGEPLTISGDGTQSRQFIYVEDLADGIVAALSPAAVKRTYNLTRDEMTSVREIAEIVQRLVAETGIVFTEGRPADLKPITVSARRAEEELGWSAHTSFEEGAGRYIAHVIDEQQVRSAEESVGRLPVGSPGAALSAPI
jgi:UDP-glucose 4-epimerase